MRGGWPTHKCVDAGRRRVPCLRGGVLKLAVPLNRDPKISAVAREGVWATSCHPRLAFEERGRRGCPAFAEHDVMEWAPSPRDILSSHLSTIAKCDSACRLLRGPGSGRQPPCTAAGFLPCSQPQARPPW